MWTNVSAQAFYTEFNLTNLSQYILPQLKNVFAVVTGDFQLINTTRRDDYTLAVYVKSVIAGSGFIPEENNIYVLIAGWDRVYNYSLMTTSNATITRYLSLNTTSFASDYNTYFVNIKNELTDGDWSYANLSNHSALIKCTDYSSFIYDCKNIGKPNFYIATRQAPSLQMVIRDELNNTHQREQKLPAGYNVINFYLIPKPFDKNLYTFGLVDYTGQYTDSVFQMQTHISYNYPQVFSRDFGSDGYVIDVECMPNHDYNLVVCSNQQTSLCASVGKYTCLKNETKTVVINTPQLGHIDYNFNDLTAGFTHNATSRAVGLTYTAESSSIINYATFNVFNTSTGNYTLTYTSTLTTPTGVFAYTLPDYNASYYIEGIFNTTTHGVLTNGRPVAQGNFTLNSRFNMTHMPANFLGISKTTFLALASYIIVVTIMLITGKGTDMGTGLIAGSLSWGLFWAFQWIPNTIPWWMFFIFMFIGVAVKWSEKRAEVVS